MHGASESIINITKREGSRPSSVFSVGVSVPLTLDGVSVARPCSSDPTIRLSISERRPPAGRRWRNHLVSARVGSRRHYHINDNKGWQRRPPPPPLTHTDWLLILRPEPRRAFSGLKAFSGGFARAAGDRQTSTMWMRPGVSGEQARLGGDLTGQPGVRGGIMRARTGAPGASHGA